MNRQEEELDAAEFVIGTLSGVERVAFEDLMNSNAQCYQDVLYWERAFGALNASISPEAPPAELWERIRGSLPASGKAKNRAAKATAGKIKKSTSKLSLSSLSTRKVEKPHSMEPDAPELEKVEAIKSVKKVGKQKKVKKAKKAELTEAVVEESAVVKPAFVETVTESKKGLVSGWWRWGAILSSLVALILAALLGSNSSNTQTSSNGFEPVVAEPAAETGEQFLAVVNADGNLPSLVLRVDAKTGVIELNSLGIVAPEGRTLQLWHSPEQQSRVSVGILGKDQYSLHLSPSTNGDLLEVSVEPEGGSPKDEPTGPIVYTGKLVKVSP